MTLFYYRAVGFSEYVLGNVMFPLQRPIYKHQLLIFVIFALPVLLYPLFKVLLLAPLVLGSTVNIFGRRKHDSLNYTASSHIKGFAEFGYYEINNSDTPRKHRNNLLESVDFNRRCQQKDLHESLLD